MNCIIFQAFSEVVLNSMSELSYLLMNGQQYNINTLLGYCDAYLIVIILLGLYTSSDF